MALQDGFGFLHRKDSDGPETPEASPVLRKPQTLRVILHDGVELGANSTYLDPRCVRDATNSLHTSFLTIGSGSDGTATIDRGSWRDTEIGPHTKIDNQVRAYLEQ